MLSNLSVHKPDELLSRTDERGLADFFVQCPRHSLLKLGDNSKTRFIHKNMRCCKKTDTGWLLELLARLINRHSNTYISTENIYTWNTEIVGKWIGITILSCSGKIRRKAIRHVNIVGVTRGVSMDETNNPEDDDEDNGADGQHEVAHHLWHGDVYLCLLFLFFTRVDLQHIHTCFRNNLWWFCILEHLMSGVKDHLKEGNGHGEEHPNVDHLDVRGDRQALR